jgi:protein-S-isoprenylcysteine O-methyltransferase Ste14
MEMQEFLLFGSGFGVVSGGRIYAPLLGRLRWVPSAEDEQRMVRTFPRRWHIVVFAALAMIFGSVLAKVLLLPERVAMLLFPTVLVVCAGTWWWRQIVLTRSWRPVDRADGTRTKVALAYLETLSIPVSVLHFGLTALFALTFARGLRSPRPVTDPEFWLALLIVACFTFTLTRALYWRGLALVRRRRTGTPLNAEQS